MNFNYIGSILNERVLPNQEIEKLIEVGSITSDVPIDPEQIQPANLDLRLGGKAFRIRASFLPGSHEKLKID